MFDDIQGGVPDSVRIMIDACRKVERMIMREYWSSEPIKVFTKSSEGDIYTEVDLKVEDILKSELSRVKPGCGFICEEGGRQIEEDSRTVFIIDPIDGTSNFLRKLPMFAISIAMTSIKRDGTMDFISGVTYAPVLRELFWACKGRGAYFEGSNRPAVRLRASGKRNLNQALLAITPNCLSDVEQVNNYCAGKRTRVRTIGSASISMAYVAAGRIEAFISGRLGIWDIAAGLLLVQEAGGRVTDLEGGRGFMESGNIVCSNGGVHSECLQMVRMK